MTKALAAIFDIQEQVTKNVSSIFSKEDVFKLLKQIETAAEADVQDAPAPEESPTQENNLEMLIDQIKVVIEERIQGIRLDVSDVEYFDYELDGDRVQVSGMEMNDDFKDTTFSDIVSEIDELVEEFENNN